MALALLIRLYDEMLSSNDEFLQNLLDELVTYPNVPEDWQLRAAQVEDEPILKISMIRNDQTITSFTTLTKFSNPYDITLQELWVECLFPADEATRQLFIQGP